MKNTGWMDEWMTALMKCASLSLTRISLAKDDLDGFLRKGCMDEWTPGEIRLASHLREFHGAGITQNTLISPIGQIYGVGD
jgi:hypothetical protein